MINIIVIIPFFMLPKLNYYDNYYLCNTGSLFIIYWFLVYGPKLEFMCVFSYGILPMLKCAIMLIRFSYIVQQVCKETSLRQLCPRTSHTKWWKDQRKRGLSTLFCNFCGRKASKLYLYFVSCQKQLTAGKLGLVASHSRHLKYPKAWERGRNEWLEYSLVQGQHVSFYLLHSKHSYLHNVIYFTPKVWVPAWFRHRDSPTPSEVAHCAHSLQKDKVITS